MEPEEQIKDIDQKIVQLALKRVGLLDGAFSSPTPEQSLSRGDQPQSADPSRLAAHCNLSLRNALLDVPKEDREMAERIISFMAGITFQAAVRDFRIAYLGPEYSYSYSAACKFFGNTQGLVAVNTIGSVFEEVGQFQSAYGVVPIENSTDGRIVDTLTKFISSPVRICGEIHLPIHHNLLARCDRSQITEVCSKPQALSQCRGWLARHLPNARWVEVASTAKAAQIAAEKPGVAAVASKDAGIALGLDIIAESIEDNKRNVTRFAVIGATDAAPTGMDKTSLMFQVPHKPGALADVMVILREMGLNMTWIESFPLPGSSNEYIFFVDIEGHRSDENVRKATKAIESIARIFTVLGSYPRGIQTDQTVA